MNHSTLQKERSCNKDVICSHQKLCYECKIARKAYKNSNNRSIRKINKKLSKGFIE